MATNDDKPEVAQVQEVTPAPERNHFDQHHEFQAVPLQEEAIQNVIHINLTWRSWLVVFISCFAVFAQVYVVVAAGQVIAFIIRDVGDASLAGWIIQGPLLVQAVLSPIVGRLSDVTQRKWLATIPPVIAFVGAVISAKATSMNMLIGGGILIGITLSTTSIVQAIPSEVLPLKYRPLAQGLCGMGGTAAGIGGTLIAGGVTNINADGWRWIFWVQAIVHGLTAIGMFLFYWPPKNTDYPEMTLRDYVWLCDPIGSLLFIVGSTLTLLALDWAGGSYPWSDPHVAAPLVIGLVLLVAFCIYEWKGRSDGLVAHVFFHKNMNFALSDFAFAVEGWIFYSAVNSYVNQVVLNLGFEDNSWSIAIRQLSFQCIILFAPLVISLYSTWYRDLKGPLVFTFVIFLIVTIFYSTILPTPEWNKAQIGVNILLGIGQAGPLTLLPACVQYTSPHAYLSTATGLAFSSRAIGGAFGSAVLNAISNGHLAANYAPAVGAAAVGAGLPQSDVPALLAALAIGETTGVPGATDAVWAAATTESHWQYAWAYHLAWASIIPFVVIAIVAVASLRGVKELMTDKVEATVENVSSDEEKRVVSDAPGA